MLINSTKETQLDDLLDRMAEEIQLDNTRYDRMKSSYNSIKDWLEEDALFFKNHDIDVYPHGSVRILTTVKPLNKDEFDLDIVLHFKNPNSFTPQEVYSQLKRSLSAYADNFGLKIDPKNRCIRLVYQGDFHVDVMPGIQKTAINEFEIKVSDKKLRNWVSSAPKGYSLWFINRVNLTKESLLERAFKSENLPTNNFQYKKPLQRAVQLIKRYRDIYFQHDNRYKTSSIILTTLAGEEYDGEDSIFEAIDNIVSKIKLKYAQGYLRTKVLNPVNPDEDFTDKWADEPQHYKVFQEFVNHLYYQWQNLKNENGVTTDENVMRSLFGENIYKKAYEAQLKSSQSQNIFDSKRRQESLANVIGNNKPYFNG